MSCRSAPTFESASEIKLAKLQVAPKQMKRWIGRRAAGAIARLLTDRNYRNAMLVRLERPANLFQPDNHTAADRYPRLFEVARRELPGQAAPRLLSFGCSTGDEVFALRRYFPSAAIRGLDISRWNIAHLRRRLAQHPDANVSVAVAGSTVREPDSAYDAIFCMAVFRHGALGGAASETCAKYIRFEDFDRTVTDIARCLRVGGLLFIEYSNFRFSDCDVSTRFEVAHTDRRASEGPQDPIYGPDDRLLPGEAYRDVAFRKRQD